MRVAAGALALALLLLSVGSSALAHPFPQTENAARGIVRDTLADADRDAAAMLRAAHALVREARGLGDALPLPGAPVPIEVRASLVQPGILGRDEMLSVVWVGATEGLWRGAYWIESSEGTSFPGLMETDAIGLLLYLDGGGLATSGSIDVTYHFLSLDGAYTRHDLGAIPLLPEVPVLDRAEIAGAHATEGSPSHPAAILVAPWNLFAHNVTMGITLLAGDTELQTVVTPGCHDIAATETEAGCRLLYALEMPPSFTTLQVWHLAEGARVVDREATRGELLAGITFGL